LRTRNKILAVALCCLCLAFSAQPAAVTASASNAAIQPFWTTLSSIALSMTYSNGQVHWGGSISGNSNVTSISATYTLEKRNANGTYSSIDSWSFSGSNSWLDSTGDKTTSKGTFRLTVSVTARTSSGTTETTSNSLVKTFT